MNKDRNFEISNRGGMGKPRTINREEVLGIVFGEIKRIDIMLNGVNAEGAAVVEVEVTPDGSSKSKWTRNALFEVCPGQVIILERFNYLLPKNALPLGFVVESVTVDGVACSAIIGPLEHIDNKPHE